MAWFSVQVDELVAVEENQGDSLERDPLGPAMVTLQLLAEAHQPVHLGSRRSPAGGKPEAPLDPRSQILRLALQARGERPGLRLGKVTVEQGQSLRRLHRRE